jgi:DNA-binding transcriptional MocR family regulator
MSTGRAFKVDRESKTPYAQQIYIHYVDAIREGGILFGTKLPSIRDLAEHLEINKIAIVTAYERLVDENMIASRPGSGYYVSFRPRRQTVPVQSNSLRAQQTRDHTLNTLLPRVVSSSGHFEKKLFHLGASHSPLDNLPMDDLRSAARSVLFDSAVTDLSYGHPQGLYELRERLMAELELRGLPVSGPEQILLTGGAVQALNLALAVLTSPGDKVATEVPSFSLLFPILLQRDLRLIEIPRSFDSMEISPDKEAELRKERPKVIIVTPTFHNPMGGVLHTRERHALLRVAHEIGAHVIELDVFHGLHFGEILQPPLSSLDSSGRTIYISSFSKVLAPGLRVGYITAAQDLVQKMTNKKTTFEISSSSLDQYLMNELLSRGVMRKHLAKSRELFRSRRDTFNAILKKQAPSGSRWTVPEGGMFLWFEFPRGATPEEIDLVARERGIALAPGSLFYPSGRESMGMRINFSLFEPVQTTRALEITFGLWRASSAKRWSTQGGDK